MSFFYYVLILVLMPTIGKYLLLVCCIIENKAVGGRKDISNNLLFKRKQKPMQLSLVLTVQVKQEAHNSL